MNRKHHYKSHLKWEGNYGEGTSNYKSYGRDYDIVIDPKPIIKGSSDPSFMGDPSNHNPEELFLVSISSCHMLWFLHLCSVAKVVVVDYTDNAQGTMTENSNGSGEFTEVTLRPEVIVSEASMVNGLDAIHKKANEMCFIARSCNFPIHHEAEARSLEESI